MYNDEQIKFLIKEMSLDEKIAQTLSISTNDLALYDREKEKVFETGELQNEKVKKALEHGIGSLQLPGKNLSVEDSVKYRNILQKYIKKNSRLKIPALVQEECLNGQLAKGATVFPRPIGMAGSFNRELVEEVFSTIGKEVRLRGGHQAFTPVLDIGRDARWGRIEETFGEDTYLVTQMGLSAVKGLQGGSEGVKQSHIVSSPKHFVGYGQSDGGRNFAPTNIPYRVLKDQILPPFEAVVKEGHALGIMPSHAEIDGIPCHGNKWLLTNLLRKEWGFDGIIVSDYGDVGRLDILHHVVENGVKAASLALTAGVDIDAPSGETYSLLKQAIIEKPELIDYLEKAVFRILSLKNKLGLFDNVEVSSELAQEKVNCDEHKNVARRMAEETVILLKNEKSILPLSIEHLNKIAIIGPTADPVEFSYYSERPNIGVSILDGIRARVKNNVEVNYEKGCKLTKEKLAMETESDVKLKNPTLYTLEEEENSIEKAVSLAKLSEVAIVCLGGSPDTSREAVTLMKHYGDNASLDLVGQQNELLRRIVATGTPTIVVLINGKPVSSKLVYEQADAILEGWYLGQETGSAIADIIFGDINPSGRLPVTIVRNSGHLPGYYGQKRTGFIKEYLFDEEGPYFWFGFGLSYTEYKYSNIQIFKEEDESNLMARVSIDVENIGAVAGKEVVQMYISDPVSTVTRPIKELKGFEKILLQPKEKKSICFNITKDMLSYTGMNDKVFEPGEFIVQIGKNSQEGLKVNIVL